MSNKLTLTQKRLLHAIHEHQPTTVIFSKGVLKWTGDGLVCHQQTYQALVNRGLIFSGHLTVNRTATGVFVK